MKYVILSLLFLSVYVHASSYQSLPSVAFRRSLRSDYDPCKDVGLKHGERAYAFGSHVSRVPHLPGAPWNRLPTIDDRLAQLIGPRQKLARYPKKPRPVIKKLDFSEITASRNRVNKN